jgi:methylenetetrahydrofolate dehydrogenase (NADP+)/methenyltetrahydrofolate cyclohydrolase
MPFPDGKVIAALDPRKDAYGYFSLGRACIPNAVMALLENNGVPIEGKHAVIVGRNRYFGLPLAQLLIRKNATVTVCHTKTLDLSWHTGQADILVTAAGKPGLITADMIKDGAIIIDTGMTMADGNWVGDADIEGVKGKAAAMASALNGVNPVATSIVLKNTADIFVNRR